MKKTAILIILAIIIIIGAIFLFKSLNTPKPTEGLTFYYGQECPHCAAVEAFLKANNIDQKVKINRLEVYHNQSNSDQMVSVAQKCGITGNQIGVPLLWDGSKCYEGEVDVENYFQQYK